MDYFITDIWDEFDSYIEQYNESMSIVDDDDFYDDDDIEFIKALYPILEYTFNESEEVFISSKRVSHEWVFERMFSVEHEAIAAVNAEETWRPYSKSYIQAGLKVDYRCNKLPRDGPQCAAKLYLLYHHDSSSIMLYRTVNQHNHLSIQESLDKLGVKNEKRKKRLRQTSILETFLSNK